jgi:hypothetical protein
VSKGLGGERCTQFLAETLDVHGDVCGVVPGSGIPLAKQRQDQLFDE